MLEQDEFADAVEQQQSIDNIINTPASNAAMQQQLIALTSLKTPKTEPKPTRGEMHPKTVHPTTKSPNSGFKLGFADLPSQPPTVASAQNTPSRSQQNAAQLPKSNSYKFTFASESNLSSEAQQLMDNVREEAARIKAQMQVEKDNQDEKDAEAEQIFNGVNASGRKIAKPKAKAGRFSDVHMAQFKKMDSIANHPSSFRAKPGYTHATTQSLKRSGSKAGLDEPERPRTAGKGTPSRIPPPMSGRTGSASPFKSIQAPICDRLENPSPAKRLRRSEADDVSASRPAEVQSAKPSAIPKSVSSTLFSPTKASLARSGQSATSSPNKQSMIPRTNSVKSTRTSTPGHRSRPSSTPVTKFTSKLIEAQQEARNKPLPPTPAQQQPAVQQASTTIRPQPTPALASAPTPKPSFSSRLPTFSGLKSILRSTRKVSANKPTERPGTPKRPNTGNVAPESMKKVDFTPSVKSRYAVKLAASSPAPAKLPSSEERQSPRKSVGMYDPAAYVLDDDGDEQWEDASSPIEYPSLPPAEPAPGPVVHTFTKKSKDHTRRESKEFKSIFTTLHHPAKPSPSTLTSVNTTVNQTSPAIHANKVMKSPSNTSVRPSPSTIRRVRGSGVTSLVQPFDDTTVKTIDHGLPAKKRRRESVTVDDRFSKDDDAKENRKISHVPSVPGGWEDSVLEDQKNVDDEGAKRGGKRARFTSSRVSGYEADAETENNKVNVVNGLTSTSEGEKGKRKSMARTQAAKNAKDRKAGVLSLSRLNVLSRPKSKG